MRIGIVCPYSWDIPGGVQAHVRDLAEELLDLGHWVSVLAPGDDDTPDLPPYVVTAGRAVPIPYNGSVARLQFGLLSATRVRRWLRDGAFDVVHVHEPAPPSLSLLACMIHDGPLVATFHAAMTRSRWLSMLDTVLQPFLEKLSGRIAVSDAARKVIVEHLGADAVVIPNGVAVSHYTGAQPLPGYPREGGTVGFIGRFDEPRKGMDVLVPALERLARQRPGLRLLVAGRGEAQEFLDGVPRILRDRIDLMGQVSEHDKARMLKSVDSDRKALLSYDEREVPFDLRVTVPVNMGADFVARSGLGDELQFVPVDPHTLLSTRHDNVFAVGDARTKDPPIAFRSG